jgi:hypothetical protein
MVELYNSRFSQPWRFRDYFRAKFPILARRYYSYMTGKWSQEELFYWWMRYVLFPTSSEFDAVEWRLGTLERDTPQEVSLSDSTPVRIAELDLTNNGQSVLLFQVGFYGQGDGRGSFDEFLVRPPSPVLRTQTSFTREQLWDQRTDYESFGGDIIRPLVIDGVTYLSEYDAAVDAEMVPDIRHQTPEKMLEPISKLLQQDA